MRAQVHSEAARKFLVQSSTKFIARFVALFRHMGVRLQISELLEMSIPSFECRSRGTLIHNHVRSGYSLYIYIYIYVFMYVCMYVCMNACMYVCICVCR